LQILSVVCQKGKVADFRILKESRIAINRETEKLADAGYQGISKIYPNSSSPVKKTKNKPLSDDQKRFNSVLSGRRIVVEHVNRRCKIFRIAQHRYRGKHRNYGKVWNVIAALVNLRYAA
jgi:transposase